MDQPWWRSPESPPLSISEAAEMCGVKRRTIRRRLQAGEFEHAFRDPDGTWRIPVNDLVAAEVRPAVVSDPDEQRIVFSAASQVDRLRTELAVLRERVRALEIIAKEREERVTDLRTILRMLPAPKVADEAAALPRAEEPRPPASDVHEEPLDGEVRKQPASEGIREAPARRPWPATEPPPATETPPAVETPPATETRPPVRVSSPFDAPAPHAASNEPIVMLPEVWSEESEPPEGALERTTKLLETARQRSAELLEDAMALWWPSAATRGQPDAAPSAARRAGPSAATPPVSSSAQASTTASDEAVAGATLTDETEASPWVERAQPPPAPRSEPPSESELFTPIPIDEDSFGWLDPDFGGPPKHLRHRLDRLFRRQGRER